MNRTGFWAGVDIIKDQYEFLHGLPIFDPAKLIKRNGNFLPFIRNSADDVRRRLIAFIFHLDFQFNYFILRVKSEIYRIDSRERSKYSINNRVYFF